MNKFTFYNAYLYDLNKLNPFQFKKLINALSDYALNGSIPEKLSNKGMAIFNKIQRVIDVEKEQDRVSSIRKIAGKKGGEKTKKSKNKQIVIKNKAKGDV